MSHNVSSKVLLLFVGGAIVIGSVVAFIQARPEKSNETTTLRATDSIPKSIETINRNTAPPKLTPKPKTTTTRSEDELCIQVITTARDPKTGDAEDYPSPCDVPEGWEIIKP